MWLAHVLVKEGGGGRSMPVQLVGQFLGQASQTRPASASLASWFTLKGCWTEPIERDTRPYCRYCTSWYRGGESRGSVFELTKHLGQVYKSSYLWPFNQHFQLVFFLSSSSSSFPLLLTLTLSLSLSLSHSLTHSLSLSRLVPLRPPSLSLSPLLSLFLSSKWSMNVCWSCRKTLPKNSRDWLFLHFWFDSFSVFFFGFDLQSVGKRCQPKADGSQSKMRDDSVKTVGKYWKKSIARLARVSIWIISWSISLSFSLSTFDSRRPSCPTYCTVTVWWMTSINYSDIIQTFSATVGDPPNGCFLNRPISSILVIFKCLLD